jgi:hypothetical protein
VCKYNLAVALSVLLIAFVCVFFSYVDITEAMDSGDASFLDTSEFHDADGIPMNDNLPVSHYLASEVSPYRRMCATFGLLYIN